MIKIKTMYRLIARTVDFNINNIPNLKTKNQKQETIKINNKQQKP